MIVSPEDDLLGFDGARFRLAFETDDYWLAADGADLVERGIRAWAA